MQLQLSHAWLHYLKTTALAVQPAILEFMGTACFQCAKFHHGMMKHSHSHVKQEISFDPLLKPWVLDQCLVTEAITSAPQVYSIDFK